MTGAVVNQVQGQFSDQGMSFAPIPDIHPFSTIKSFGEIKSHMLNLRPWTSVRIMNHPKMLERDNTNPGKWMLFIPHIMIVDVFKKLASMTLRFELTHTLKVSGGLADEHIVLVYLPDYNNITQVREIAQKLQTLRYIRTYGSPPPFTKNYYNPPKYIYFKPDVPKEYKRFAKSSELTLYRFSDQCELSVRDHRKKRPVWRVADDDDALQLESYELFLHGLKRQADEHLLSAK